MEILIQSTIHVSRCITISMKTLVIRIHFNNKQQNVIPIGIILFTNNQFVVILAHASTPAEETTFQGKVVRDALGRGNARRRWEQRRIGDERCTRTILTRLLPVISICKKFHFKKILYTRTTAFPNYVQFVFAKSVVGSQGRTTKIN